ncbi:MAG: hypothetical protein AUI14_09380 [Actinobacteria bacterium 13_2_20CM_2_71_6]|nr:MAG: hypothetical protein AUI14_09380 [Actinobacteria bacterium 13_2_20CM_2_71_6]
MERIQHLADVDVTTPNVARMYDYYLGGLHNLEVDRAAAEKVMKIFPDTPVAARTNRDFLRRAVRYLAAEAGIRQFLDIGSGLPTEGNVHEVAHSVAPDARVVYVDHDPVAVAYARALLTGQDRVGVVQADLRSPDDVLGAAEVRRLLDLSAPVAVLLVAVLHFQPDDADPYASVAQLRDAVAPGSHLVVSHLTLEGIPDDIVQHGREVYRQATSPIVPRSRADIGRFLDGYQLIEPGLVWLADWRPDERSRLLPAASHGFGAVGRAPG